MGAALATPGHGLPHGAAVVHPIMAGEPTLPVFRIGAETKPYDDQLSEIAGRLGKLAQEQVRAKSPVEDRWLDSVRAYHGIYSKTLLKALEEAKQSTAYVKATRAKTIALEARLFDLIFPTDDRNWGISPTPVPKLAGEMKEAQTRAENAALQATEASQAGDQAREQQIVAAGQDEASRAAAAEDEIEKVNQASKQMQEEMDDQLVESHYPSESRKAIGNFCQLGTAILKGPVVNESTRGRWLPANLNNAQAQPHEYELEQRDDPRPRYRWVDPWSFFPDMSARYIDECEFTFERYLWTASDLRRMVKTNSFDPDAVRELLRDDKQKATRRANTSAGLANLVALRALTEDSTGTIKGRYIGWEYHGALECSEVVAILNAMGREDEAIEYDKADDPLIEHRVVVYFCDNVILKIAPEYPLDSGETLYSVANLEDAEGSIFGYGIPAILFDSQNALNSAWRAALDNGAMSVGPQMVIDKTLIQPADGSWVFAPKKIWQRIKAAIANEPDPVKFFNVPNNQAELANIAKMAMEFMDIESGIPQPQQGEQGAHTTQTVGGMAILQNAANIVFRRIVKNWDDGIIAPSMRRLYDWNMQHSPRAEIKGDMQVDARGTSVLLVKEVQATNLMLIVSQLMANPAIAPMLKKQGYPAIEKLFQSMMIKPSEVLVSEDEWTKTLDEQQKTPPPPSPAEIAAKARVDSAQINADSRKGSDQVALQIAQAKERTALFELAHKGDITVAELQAMLSREKLHIDSKERMMVSEAAIERQNADEERARGEQPTGSGGFFSEGTKKQ